MKKAMTSIVAIVILISMTVVAGAIAFMWINSVQSSLLQKVGGNVENAPGTDCTRLHLISVQGDRAVVKNVGCSNVTEFNMLINGRLTKYTLDEPLAPGESTIITYSPQTVGEDLTVTIVGSWGSTSLTSPAEDNTENAGFVSYECGNNICEYSDGENQFNCFKDCGVATLFYAKGNYLVSAEYITKPDNVSFGAFADENIVYSLNPDYDYELSVDYYNDTLAIAVLSTYDSSTQDMNLSYSLYNGSSWSDFICFRSCDIGTDVVYYARVAFNSSGAAHIFYVNNSLTSRDVVRTVFYPLTNSWSDDVKINSVSEGMGETDIAVSDDDKIFMGWMNDTLNNGGPSSAPFYYKYTYFNGTDWINGEFPYYGVNLSYPEIIDVDVIFNNESTLMLTYVNRSMGDIVRYSIFNGSTWTDPRNVNDSVGVYGGSKSNGLLNKDNLFVSSYFVCLYPRYGFCSSYSTYYDGSSWSPLEPTTTKNGFVNYLLAKVKSNYTTGAINVENGVLSPYHDYDYVSFSNGRYRLTVNITSCSDKQKGDDFSDFSGCYSNAGKCYNLGCEMFESCSADCYNEYYCDDGVDNDGDGLVDDNDPDCSLTTETYCFDNLDNDGDGLIDFEDSDCSGCGDGICTSSERNSCIADCGINYIITGYSEKDDPASYYSTLRYVNPYSDYRTDEVKSSLDTYEANYWDAFNVLNSHYTKNFFALITKADTYELNFIGWDYDNDKMRNLVYIGKTLPGGYWSVPTDHFFVTYYNKSDMTYTWKGFIGRSFSGEQSYYYRYDGTGFERYSVYNATLDSIEYEQAIYLDNSIIAIYPHNYTADTANGCYGLTYNYSLDDGITWNAGGLITGDETTYCNIYTLAMTKNIFVAYNPNINKAMVVWPSFWSNPKLFMYSIYDPTTNSWSAVDNITDTLRPDGAPLGSQLVPIGDDFIFILANTTYKSEDWFKAPNMTMIYYNSSSGQWSNELTIGPYKMPYALPVDNNSRVFVAFVDGLNNSLGCFIDENGCDTVRTIINPYSLTLPSDFDKDNLYVNPFVYQFGNNSICVMNVLTEKSPWWAPGSYDGNNYRRFGVVSCLDESTGSFVKYGSVFKQSNWGS